MVGVGIAWIGSTLLRNEKELEKRRSELEMEVGKKEYKSKQILLNKSHNQALEI